LTKKKKIKHSFFPLQQSFPFSFPEIKEQKKMWRKYLLLSPLFSLVSLRKKKASSEGRQNKKCSLFSLPSNADSLAAN